MNQISVTAIKTQSAGYIPNGKNVHIACGLPPAKVFIATEAFRSGTTNDAVKAGDEVPDFHPVPKVAAIKLLDPNVGSVYLAITTEQYLANCNKCCGA